MRRDIKSLIVGIFAMSIAGCLLFLVYSEMAKRLIEVVVIMAGALFIAALASFQRFLAFTSQPSIRITFDAPSVEALLQRLVAGTVSSKPAAEPVDVEWTPWEPTSDNLVGKDNTLALAKLRIDIERELRRIAYYRNKEAAHGSSLTQLVTELARKGAVPQDAASALHNILPLLNQAVHGADVTTDVAIDVLRVGNQLLNLLRQYSSEVMATAIRETTRSSLS